MPQRKSVVCLLMEEIVISLGCFSCVCVCELKHKKGSEVLPVIYAKHYLTHINQLLLKAF